MSEPRGPSRTGILTTLGVGALAVLCCAGPALLAGGALSGLGGVLGNPWLIAVGAVLVVAALGYPIARRTRRRAASGLDVCCPPEGRAKAALRNPPAEHPVDIEKGNPR